MADSAETHRRRQLAQIRVEERKRLGIYQKPEVRPATPTVQVRQPAHSIWEFKNDKANTGR